METSPDQLKRLLQANLPNEDRFWLWEAAEVLRSATGWAAIRLRDVLTAQDFLLAVEQKEDRLIFTPVGQVKQTIEEIPPVAETEKPKEPIGD